ncbi:MAG: carbohydrate-binding domain-containing protein [Clostridia bacterium]|nr:carbohydrate-binding domain-containing protein [Clostridia bacterium]
MKNQSKMWIYAIVIIILLTILGVLLKFALWNDTSSNNALTGSNSSTGNNTSSGNSTSTTNQEVVKTSTSLEQKKNRGEVSYSNYDAKIDLSTLSSTGNGVSINGTTIKITKAGTYYFTGTAENANIVINAGDDDNVVLVFENADITSKTTSVINGVKAKNIMINLKEGSTNTFTDSSNYTEFTGDDEHNATVFSKTDLIFNGTGTLIVNANYKDGIKSKDDLVITNVTLKITSVDDGLRGKDCVDIKDANITITSTGDGIKSTNDSNTEKGYIIIDGGNINIQTKEDGIQAETVLTISNVDMTIQTTGDTKDTNVSSKGLKAEKEITINSGNINITSTDDSIHSNYYIIINGGTMTLSSGDYGIHADTNIIINGGTMNITKSYEGIEAAYIEINDGDIKLVASDDGINASDGSGSSGPGKMMQQSSNADVQLVVNGGTIYIDAQGDGLDSNGNITQTGGSIIVAGTTNGGDGAIDYDGTFYVSGGSLVAYGATSMWQNPSTSSSQYSICFSQTGKEGDTIELKDSKGNTIESIQTAKAYGAIVFSNSKLTKGETYTLYVNGSQASSQELTSIVTSNLSSQGIMGGGGMMNGGGRQGK